MAWLKNQLKRIDRTEEHARLPDRKRQWRSVPDPSIFRIEHAYWNAEARAAMVGMTAFHSKEHIVRAALESIAYQIRDVMEMMRTEGGVRPRLLFADGGPTRNEFLMQFTADMIAIGAGRFRNSGIVGVGRGDGGNVRDGMVGSMADLADLAARGRVVIGPKMGAADGDRLYSEWKWRCNEFSKKKCRTTGSSPNT